MDENSFIVGLIAEPKEGDKIRLKFLSISGGVGPDITMDKSLAEETVKALQAALSGERYVKE